VLNFGKPREECGIFGIYAPGEDVAKLTFFGLFTLQHRGQESAGIGVLDGKKYSLYKKMGLVNQVFNEEKVSKLKGHIAVGHNRYSTTGTSNLKNAGPFVSRRKLETFVVGHNGNIVNADRLRKVLERKGKKFKSTCDSEVVAQIVADAKHKDPVKKIFSTMYKLNGAYSLIIGTKNELIGARDPLGFRPLCIGQLNGWYVLASESCAFPEIGAKLIRDVEPGEVVVVNENGLKSYKFSSRKVPSFCIFEYVYLARPDSTINTKSVYLIREKFGKLLAKEHPVEADIVVPVPDSGIPGAIGYSQQSKIPYREGLIKNRYIARTFIFPDQRMRDLGVKMKLSPLREVVLGKRVVLIDDSIVRGTTALKIVRLIKEAGAKEVHVRITSPPIKNPCYYGVDMPKKEDFIANRQSVEEIRQQIEASSLGYLSVSNMIKATGLPNNSFCTACFSKKYPLRGDFLNELTKEALEESMDTSRS
jgi:amidophosphoribosyltransferase